MAALITSARIKAAMYRDPRATDCARLVPLAKAPMANNVLPAATNQIADTNVRR